MGKKKRIIASILTILCMALAAAGCGKVSVGYVDQARVQQEAPQIKASIEEMQGEMSKFQQEGEKQLQEAAASGKSPEEMQKLQQQLQMRGASLQQSYATQINAKMDAALGDIAKEKKLDTVVNSNTKDGVIITGGVDVTDEVISKLQ